MYLCTYYVSQVDGNSSHGEDMDTMANILSSTYGEAPLLTDDEDFDPQPSTSGTSTISGYWYPMGSFKNQLPALLSDDKDGDDSLYNELPNIPYTPMFKDNAEPQHSTSPTGPFKVQPSAKNTFLGKR